MPKPPKAARREATPKTGRLGSGNKTRPMIARICIETRYKRTPVLPLAGLQKGMRGAVVELVTFKLPSF